MIKNLFKSEKYYYARKIGYGIILVFLYLLIVHKEYSISKLIEYSLGYNLGIFIFVTVVDVLAKGEFID